MSGVEASKEKAKKPKLTFIVYEDGEFRLVVKGNLSVAERVHLSDFLKGFTLSSGNLGSQEVSSFSFTSISSVSARVWSLIASRFRGSWFSSSELRHIYSEVYGEKLPKNVASTYLYRLSKSGKLERKKEGRGYRYFYKENPEFIYKP